MPSSGTSSTRSSRTQLGRPAESHGPLPSPSQPLSSSRFSWEDSWSPRRRSPSRPTTRTGRSLPRPSFSSNATHVHTISPGSAPPSRSGAYTICRARLEVGSVCSVAGRPPDAASWPRAGEPPRSSLRRRTSRATVSPWRRPSRNACLPTRAHWIAMPYSVAAHRVTSMDTLFVVLWHDEPRRDPSGPAELRTEISRAVAEPLARLGVSRYLVNVRDAEVEGAL